MAIGFFLGSSAGFDWLMFFHALFGTFLIASGTSAHNQYVERDLDKLMFRTQKRPLPMHKITAAKAFGFSFALMIAGGVYLITQVNLVAAVASALTSVIYLGMYTPLKKVSFLNLYVGAIPGALPPLGGWAAATGNLSTIEPWLLFGVVFLWQVPHVTAIAWMYLDDYKRADFVMLPKNDASGIVSASISVFFAVLLLPLTYALVHFDMGGWITIVGAGLSAVYYLWRSIEFLLDRTHAKARNLLLASVIYLPLVWIVLFIERLV